MATIKEVMVDSKEIKAAYPASTAVAIGDLLWNNSGAPAKASAQTDQLTPTANQRLFASRFLGVAKDQRLSAETAAGDRVVTMDGVFDASCASTTWAVGDLVGAVEDSGGTFLENQKVAKVTDITLAIGYCVKAGTSLTTVRCRLISKYLPGDIRSAVRNIIVDKVTQSALTGTATVTVAQLLSKILDGTPTGAATYTLPTAADLVAAIPGVSVGDSFSYLVNNKSAGANTITMGSGSGGTDDGTLTVAQNVIRRFTIIITNVTGSSEAYFNYGEG